MKKNKVEKQKDVVRNVQLLTSRPKGMSYEDYKEIRLSNFRQGKSLREANKARLSQIIINKIKDEERN